LSRGKTFLGWLYGANAETQLTGCRYRTLITPETLTTEYSPEFLAWVLLHEAVHMEQGAFAGFMPSREYLPESVASVWVLNDIQKFYQSLSSEQKVWLLNAR
jgi:hypothetical protein